MKNYHGHIRYDKRVIHMCDIHTEKMVAKVSKILLDTDLKIILLDHQNNYVHRLNLVLKHFAALPNLSDVHNYFDGPTKLFSNLYPAKFLDIFHFRKTSFCARNAIKLLYEKKNIEKINCSSSCNEISLVSYTHLTITHRFLLLKLIFYA